MGYLAPLAWLVAVAVVGGVAVTARERGESVVAPLALHLGGTALALALLKLLS